MICEHSAGVNVALSDVFRVKQENYGSFDHGERNIFRRTGTAARFRLEGGGSAGCEKLKKITEKTCQKSHI